MIAIEIGLLLLAGSATAQSANAKKEALRHFATGEAHMKAGEYDQAIVEYRAAYAAVPKPGFYYNIARAYELKGDREHALEYYTKYLELDPHGRASAEARTRAVTIEHELADEARAREAPAGEAAGGETAGSETAGGETDATTETADATPDGATAEVTGTSPVETVERRHRPSSGRGYRIAGIGLGAAGVAMLAAGVYFGLQVSAKEDDLAPYYAGDKSWDDTADSLESQGKRAATSANLLLGASAIAVASGAVLYYLGWRKGHRATAGVVLVPKQEGGLAVTWTCGF